MTSNKHDPKTKKKHTIDLAEHKEFTELDCINACGITTILYLYGISLYKENQIGVIRARHHIAETPQC